MPSGRSVAPVDQDGENGESEQIQKTSEQLQKAFISSVALPGSQQLPQRLLQDALCCCALVDAADPVAQLKRMKNELCFDDVCVTKQGTRPAALRHVRCVAGLSCTNYTAKQITDNVF